MLEKTIQVVGKYHSVLELAIIQGANAVFPVLVFPFILITLGGEIFSTIAVGEVLALYILIFSLYSFDIISVQKVISSLTQQEIFKVYVLTLICRLCLFGISSVLFICLIYFINKTLCIYVMLFLLYPLGMVLQSNYFFQAINNNRPLAFFVFISRVISLLLIYFYKSPSDDIASYYYVVCVSGSYFLSGFLSALYIFLKNKGVNVNIKMVDVYDYIKIGYHLFIANVFVILYRNSNIIILGLLASPIATSLYATAEKIIKCVQAIATPLNQFYFTSLIKNHEMKVEPYCEGEYKKQIYTNTKIQLKIMAMIIIGLGCVGIVLSYKIDSVNEIRHAIIPLSIMSLAILMGIFNFMFGSVGLSIRGFKKDFSYITAITGTSTILLSFCLSYLFSEVGAAIAYVLAEFILLILILKVYTIRKL